MWVHNVPTNQKNIPIKTHVGVSDQKLNRLSLILVVRFCFSLPWEDNWCDWDMVSVLYASVVFNTQLQRAYYTMSLSVYYRYQWHSLQSSFMLRVKLSLNVSSSYMQCYSPLSATASPTSFYHSLVHSVHNTSCWSVLFLVCLCLGFCVVLVLTTCGVGLMKPLLCVTSPRFGKCLRACL